MNIGMGEYRHGWIMNKEMDGWMNKGLINEGMDELRMMDG